MFRSFFDALRDAVSSVTETVVSTLVDLVGGDEAVDLPDTLEEAVDLEGDFTDNFDVEFSDDISESDDISGGFESVILPELEDYAEELEDTVSELEEIEQLVSRGLDIAQHPHELGFDIGYRENLMDYIDEILEDYRDTLIQRYGFSLENNDNNYTERELYSSYEELIAYLQTFNGGYPDEDIIDIVIDDEGYRLYVAINSA